MQRFGTGLLCSTLVYSGDPAEVGLYLAIVNQSLNSLRVRFPTEQQFDFALKDHCGDEYWRWSTGRIFEQTASEIVVAGGPRGGFHVFGDEVDPMPLPGAPGDFVTLEGSLLSTDLPSIAELAIKLQLP